MTQILPIELLKTTMNYSLILQLTFLINLELIGLLIKSSQTIEFE